MTVPLAQLMAVLVAVPGADISRDGARRAAQRELAKAVYAGNEPSLLARAVRAVLHALEHALDSTAARAPGGIGGLVLLVLVIVGLVVAIRLRLGPLARAGKLPDTGLGGGQQSAADHRAEAERLAAAGEWALAVRERLRAIVAELEARGVLDRRPGRTADEVATEAGRAVPDVAGIVREATTIFDEIWYGGRAATSANDARLGEIDAAVARRRLAVTEQPTAGQPTARQPTAGQPTAGQPA